MQKKIPIFIITILFLSFGISKAQSNITYIVQPGDSLSAIVNDFNTTIEMILKLNNISNPRLIQAGQEIIVSESEIVSTSPTLKVDTNSHAISTIQTQNTIPKITPVAHTSTILNTNLVSETTLKATANSLKNILTQANKKGRGFTLLELVIILLSGILLLLSMYFAETRRRVIQTYEKRFGDIIIVDTEVENVQRAKAFIESDFEKLRNQYKDKRQIFDSIVKEAAIYDEQIELAELGFYKRHYDFGTSENFKKRINSIREKQKTMIQNKTAIVCDIAWEVDGNRAKGKTMIARATRLTARAFNSECDAAIAKVRWSNIRQMEARIEKAFDAINKMNKTLQTSVSSTYFDLKIQELRLTHELYEKKQQEKEEQSEIRRLQNEEKTLIRETKEAQQKEWELKKLLENTKQQAISASEQEQYELREKINQLTIQLAEAHARSERALSMAEITKAGHVYVISNVGSFGYNVFKIGMTRRLEPMNRVKELSSASVPFIFDTHALIFSEDAPALEAELHRVFSKKRLNLVNNRKEFFSVTLQEIREEVQRLSPNAEFFEEVEAQDYKETLSLLSQYDNPITVENIIAEFPATL